MPRSDALAGAVTDARLIAASLEQPTDFAALFDRHYGELAGYLGRRVGASLADELASETFVAAFAARGRYDAAQADARPWLYGIANNLLRKHARSKNRRRRAYARSIERETVTSDTESAERRADGAGRPALAVALNDAFDGSREELPFSPRTAKLLGEQDVVVKPPAAFHVKPGTVTYATTYLSSGIVKRAGHPPAGTTGVQTSVSIGQPAPKRGSR
jgi:RNA polymerase sigma-70 factor (ECF subfamily)